MVLTKSWAGPCLSWGEISSTRVISALMQDVKKIHIFIYTKDCAHKLTQRINLIFNPLRPNDVILHHGTLSTLVQVMEWFVLCSVPNHYLNQCQSVDNWTIGNKFQWHFNENSDIFIQENVYENICKMGTIFFRAHWVIAMMTMCLGGLQLSTILSIIKTWPYKYSYDGNSRTHWVLIL